MLVSNVYIAGFTNLLSCHFSLSVLISTTLLNPVTIDS